jgi:hypothetical protein
MVVAQLVGEAKKQGGKDVMVVVRLPRYVPSHQYQSSEAVLSMSITTRKVYCYSQNYVECMMLAVRRPIYVPLQALFSVSVANLEGRRIVHCCYRRQSQKVNVRMISL